MNYAISVMSALMFFFIVSSTGGEIHWLSIALILGASLAMSYKTVYLVFSLIVRVESYDTDVSNTLVNKIYSDRQMANAMLSSIISLVVGIVSFVSGFWIPFSFLISWAAACNMYFFTWDFSLRFNDHYLLDVENIIKKYNRGLRR